MIIIPRIIKPHSPKVGIAELDAALTTITLPGIDIPRESCKLNVREGDIL